MKREFNLQLALAGHAVETRDGRKVSGVKETNKDAPYSAESVDEFNGEQYAQGVSAVIHNKCGKSTYPFYHDGGAHLYGGRTEADLVMVAQSCPQN
ncbi:hypothetical protein [Vibrio owensii]|uniref:hypothetical protein n=1 Tax=Vibrio harveyi group TaxID=717610 RepID=UPI003CC59C29